MSTRVQRTATILADHNGEITKQDHWGVRRLAYEIENQDKGNYMLLKFKSDETVVKELDRAFRLDDMILRHLIVKDEEWQERNRAAADKRRRAAAEVKKAPASE
jgi:small subunit ribosomal protein S6